MSIRGKYGKWTESNMQKALTAFQNGEAGLNEIARTYNIPKATLKRRIENKNKHAHGSIKKFGRVADLPAMIEEEIVEHILRLEEFRFEITPGDLRKLAYHVAEANGIKHRFKNGKAGKKWYSSFMSRHKELCFRQSKATSSTRTLDSSRDAVMEFFNVLTNLYNKFNFSPLNIFNMDEIDLSTAQKPQKIGLHQIEAITSSERDRDATCICCINATGSYMPPMLILKRTKFENELKEGAPPCTKFACSKSGLITNELFVVWLNHFIECVKPSKNNKCVLILAGHVTREQNLEAAVLARKNGIIMVSIPANTTQSLRPCEVSFFKQLSRYYNQEAEIWLQRHPNQNITQFQVSQLFGEAYGKAASVGNAINGFAKCGIWPLNRNVFQDNEFTATPSNDIEREKQNQDVVDEGKEHNSCAQNFREQSVSVANSSQTTNTDNKLPSLTYPICQFYNEKIELEKKLRKN